MREALLKYLEPVVFEAQSTIIRANTMGTRMFFVQSGNCLVLVDGRVRAMRTRGDFIGEIALIYATERMADVVAGDEDVEVFALSRPRFLTVATHFPELYEHLKTGAAERMRCQGWQHRMQRRDMSGAGDAAEPREAASSPPGGRVAADEKDIDSLVPFADLLRETVAVLAWIMFACVHTRVKMQAAAGAAWCGRSCKMFTTICRMKLHARTHTHTRARAHTHTHTHKNTPPNKPHTMKSHPALTTDLHARPPPTCRRYRPTTWQQTPQMTWRNASTSSSRLSSRTALPRAKSLLSRARCRQASLSSQVVLPPCRAPAIEIQSSFMLGRILGSRPFFSVGRRCIKCLLGRRGPRCRCWEDTK